MAGHRDPQGAMWRRWDPHIHAPGTVLNDQYGRDDPWEQFLTRIEASDPAIRALGIADYYSLDAYEQARARKAQGRLPKVELIFPNIEMRYGIGTAKGSPINLHLLASPDDPNHIEETRRFLLAFTFNAYGESFRCSRADLIKLGKAHDRSISDERAALAVGTNQFKINPDQLKEEWDKSSWVQQNILIAVAAGSDDGTSGLQTADASLAALRKEIEKTAHVIFSGHPKQREFWIGRGAASIEQLKTDWGGCKPCLHGSDAHHADGVGAPTGERYCWVKGDITFESLRQACLEPEYRTHIGATAPRGAFPSQVISEVTVSNALWLQTSTVPINAGLVGIIGARGSGKTALAEIVAAGGFALSSQLTEKSFIRRARPYLGQSKATLTWEDGNESSNEFQSVEFEDLFDAPRVQYLSQQFVDTLCSAEGVTDELLAEIERVVYQAHPAVNRMGTTTFRELLDLRAAPGRALRNSQEQSLAEIASELNVERSRKASLPGLKRQRTDKANAIDKDKRDRARLVSKGGEERANEFDAVSRAAETVRGKIEQARRRRAALVGLQNDVADARANKAPLRLRQLQQAHAEAGLAPQVWKAFRQDFVGDVDKILRDEIAAMDALIRTLTGLAVEKAAGAREGTASKQSLLPAGAKLEEQTLGCLEKEATQLRALIGIDAENAKAFARLSEKISRDEAALAKMDRDIAVAIAADARIQELIQERRDGYARVFDGIVAEERELAALYEPLRARLEGESGALGKLTFSIRRKVDIAAWTAQGEELLDLRMTGPFKGRGSLREAARLDLLPAWETGNSAGVADAMSRFREKHENSLRDHMPVDRADAAAVREWGGKVSAWLYSTNHIKLAYSVQYEGADIGQLSPGTRGIVLLLLYLAIDWDDDRPLIIDQPEENLDPKSVFDELVERFRRAKLRRQIIIVTHNANLIVNTDVDQVIVASCGPHRPGQLPEITYESGGLENPEIRRKVCDILEGGEVAFKERAKRLRVRI